MILESIRTAAALSVSAGKTRGFAEGLRLACDELERTLVSGTCEPLRPFVERMRKIANEHDAQSEALGQAAELMISRLSKRSPTLRARLGRALAALISD